MKTTQAKLSWRRRIVICSLLLLGCAGQHLFAQGTAFTYQGRLQNGSNAVSSVFDLRFALFDAASGGVQQGTSVTNTALPVTNGLFTVTLDFSNQFGGAARWLEIGVRSNGAASFTTLSPRQKLTPAPYAIFAASAAGLPGMTTQPNSGNGAASVIGGASVNFIGSTVVGGTIAGGGAANYQGVFLASNVVTADFGTVGGGFGNTVSGTEAVVAGGHYNKATAGQSFVGGGRLNQANGGNSVVAGGDNSVANGVAAAIVGGASNSGFGNFSFIGGGWQNQAGDYSAVGGGKNNLSAGTVSVVAGGEANSILTTADHSAIGGGLGNFHGNNAWESFLGGGQNNTNLAQWSVLVGGLNNSVGGGGLQFGVLGGGDANLLNGSYSTLGGGLVNRIDVSADYSFIGGGRQNVIELEPGALFYPVYCTIAGGYGNRASVDSATVGGGANNFATNVAATVPGGSYNAAGGRNSFAAGQQAKALHDGSFVWADSSSVDFASTAAKQFLIRAAGNVGINTNNPQATLDVNGSLRINSGTVFNRVQDGIFSAGSSPGVIKVFTNSFPRAFSNIPTVVANTVGEAGSDNTDVFALTVRWVTKTNFAVTIYRVDSASGWAQNLRVAYHAWE